jgi:hypothetical protein
MWLIRSDHTLAITLICPQLIVCGDRPSGKSSVPKAISGFRFPTNSVSGTRFATELILRRSPKTNTLVTIVPGGGRIAFDKETPETWKSNDFELGEFPLIADLAQRAMGLTSRKNAAPTHKNAASSGRATSSDVLRVEIIGPKQPQSDFGRSSRAFSFQHPVILCKGPNLYGIGPLIPQHEIYSA